VKQRTKLIALNDTHRDGAKRFIHRMGWPDPYFNLDNALEFADGSTVTDSKLSRAVTVILDDLLTLRDLIRLGYSRILQSSSCRIEAIWFKPARWKAR
jgi:hypothetical protein